MLAQYWKKMEYFSVFSFRLACVINMTNVKKDGLFNVSKLKKSRNEKQTKISQF